MFLKEGCLGVGGILQLLCKRKYLKSKQYWIAIIFTFHKHKKCIFLGFQTSWNANYSSSENDSGAYENLLGKNILGLSTFADWLLVLLHTVTPLCYNYFSTQYHGVFQVPLAPSVSHPSIWVPSPPPTFINFPTTTCLWQVRPYVRLN